MFSIWNLFNQTGIKSRSKETVTGWRSGDSNVYLYPAMTNILKSIRRNHCNIVDPDDGSSSKVRAVIETKDGDIGAWLADNDTFTICKINVIRGLPIITESILYEGKNVGSIEKSIRRYNDTHDYVIVSWVAC